MSVFPGLIALGVVQGLLSALFAAGLVVTHRTHRFLNLSHAGLGLVPGALVGVLVSQAGWSFWGAAPVGIAAGAVLGVAAERAIFARLANAPRLILMVASLGLAQLLAATQTALPLAVGGIPPTYSVPWDARIDIFPVVLTSAHILTLIAAPLSLLLLALFLRSRPGLGAQAVGQNAERARSLGVPAALVSTTAFAVIGAAAAVAGILAVPVLGFSLEGSPGVAVLLLALAPAAVAGFRNLGVAAAAAVLLGVIYQLVLWYGNARNGTLMLAAVAGIAVALRPPAGDRRERALRASSWPAAPPIRPGAAAPWMQIAGPVAAVALGVAWVSRLGPSDAQLVATGAALALGALSLAVGWCLAGELSLATWPAAGVAALVAMNVAGGPWVAAPLALITGGAAICALGLLVRQRGTLALAVVSLAAGAGLAELAQSDIPRPTALSLDPRAAAVGALVLCGLATAVFSALRRSPAGHRLVAARDDARRARSLGISPSAARLAGLGLSGALAGLAGLTYVLAVSQPAPGAFGADRSLDLLAMAVVGGLGSFWGAVAGAGILVAARVLLEGGWATLGSGLGMLIAVLFFPGGLAAAADRARRAVSA